MIEGQSPVVYIGSENAPRRKAVCRSTAAWSSEELLLQGGPLGWIGCQMSGLLILAEKILRLHEVIILVGDFALNLH